MKIAFRLLLPRVIDNGLPWWPIIVQFTHECCSKCFSHDTSLLFMMTCHIPTLNVILTTEDWSVYQVPITRQAAWVAYTWINTSNTDTLIVNLTALDRAAKQRVRKTVEGSGESIHKLNCSCNKDKKIGTCHFTFSRFFWVNKYNKAFSLINFKSQIDGVLSPSFCILFHSPTHS